MYSYGPPLMAEQKQDDQLEHTYSSYVKIWDVVWKTCRRRWTIGKSGERGSGITVRAAWHDDDYFHLLICTLLLLQHILNRYRVSKVGKFSQGVSECSLFNSYYTNVGKDATPFLGSLHFTLHSYLIMLSVKQGGIKYHFWVFGMTRPEIELQSARPLMNTLPIRPMFIYISIYLSILKSF